MTKEMKKSICNKEKIKESMDRTFEARRHWVKTEHPLVQELLNTYPALKAEDEVRHEFQRLTGVEADTALLAFLSRCGETVLKLCTEKKALRAHIEEFYKKVEKLTTSQQKYHFAVEVLKSLPALVRENWQNLFTKLEPGQAYAYPSIIYTGNDPLTTQCITVKAEGLSIEVPDITSAVSLLLCIYWTFDIEYAPHLKNTLCILERMIGVEYTPLTSVPLRVLTTLKA
ncbi:uncharacterized protein LOC135373913 [Ornithodoros turicata]|uniref:uncharacterized protein LOC135373913 n=1 Tax=Ornithodoros turicata TaxID=34597 RepID=UPI0031389EFA